MKWPFSKQQADRRSAAGDQSAKAASPSGTIATTGPATATPQAAVTSPGTPSYTPPAPSSPAAWTIAAALQPMLSSAPTVTQARSFVANLATRQSLVRAFEPHMHADRSAPAGAVYARLASPAVADRGAGILPDGGPPSLPTSLPSVESRRLTAIHRPTEGLRPPGSSNDPVRIHTSAASVGGSGHPGAPDVLSSASNRSADQLTDVGSTIPESNRQQSVPFPAPPVPAGESAADGPRTNSGRQRRLGLGAPTSDVPASAVVASGERFPDDIREAIQLVHQTNLDDVEIDRRQAVADEARRLDATAFARDDVIHLPAAAGSIDSAEVRGLLAHELTHIAQQRRLGQSLPGEDSEEGRRLEAQARVAHQFFRGDAGAPQPQPLRAIDRNSLLTTGVADVDTTGRVSYGPASAELVQRQVARATTPDYAWQRRWLDQHHPSAGLGEETAGLFSLRQESPDEATAGIEEHYQRELNDFREEQRRALVAASAEADARRAYAELPPAAASIPAGISAAERPIAEQIVVAQEELTHATTARASEVAVPTARNRAVDQVEQQYAIRHFDSDTLARHQAVPTGDSEQMTAARARLTEIQRDHGDLVHRVLGTGTGAAGAPSASPPAAGATSSSAAPAAPVTSTGTTAPGVGGATITSPPGARSPGGGPMASAVGGALGAAAGAAAVFSWEQGVYNLDSASVSDGLEDLFSLREPTEADRQARADREEAEHAEPLRQARHDYFKQLVDQKVDEIRRAAHANPTATVPDEQAALHSITRAEWQAMIQTVERDRPMHDLSEANRLLNDPRNHEYKALIDAAPATRPAPGATTPAAPGAEAAAGAAPGAAVAHTAAGAEHQTTPAPAAGAGAAATGAHPSPAPAGPALGGGVAHQAHPLAAAGAAVLTGGAAAATAHHAGAAEQAHSFAPEPHEIELSPELIRRLSTELYVRLRSQLRSELIVDRERAGVLTDFR